ncbi:hypothetical protein DL98DRAFT_659718 [Cadophora sp. DSE1049]|nr:hypothetical protein DL98DRAFT_659718 [Cadophora sp. DSE1049]
MSASSPHLPDLGNNEIRLLHIIPGAFTSPIHCALKAHSLSSKPAYDALSYTWNNTGGLQTITVNGVPCNVTSNLELALRHLRPQEGEGVQELVLWVDALCINQSNDGEKAVQVGMMGEIYRGARKVRAWIGGRDEDDVDVDVDVEGVGEAGQEEMSKYWTVWRLLEVFGTSKRFDCWDAEQPHKLKPGQALDEMANLLTDCWEADSGRQSWKVMATMLKRPYWRRVWIQQELYNNREVIVHCGLKSAPFEYWTRALEAHSYECNLDPSNRTIKLPSGRVRSVSQEVLHAGSIVVWFGLGRRYHERVKGRQAHFRLLREQLSRGATDPRDKIYGILDMVECWAEGRFTADYTASTAQVYIRAVHSTIEHWKSLDILLDTMPCPISMRMPDLPTWCPDWNHFITVFEDGSDEGADLKWGNVPYGLNRWGDNKFDYSRNNICHTESADDGRMLYCYGIVLDHVRDVVDGPWSPAQEEPTYENLERLLRLTGAEHDPGRREALWRTLVSNRAWDPAFDSNPQTFVQAPDDFSGRFETWLEMHRLRQRLSQIPEDESLQPLRTDGNLLAKAVMPVDKQPEPSITSEQAVEQVVAWQHPFLVSCQIATRWRRFFMTRDDHMGLAPLHILPGDMLVVLYGASLPVILRPVGTYFEFVGEAYVNEWERGEAFNLAEKGELKECFFEIH